MLRSRWGVCSHGPCLQELGDELDNATADVELLRRRLTSARSQQAGAYTRPLFGSTQAHSVG